MFSSSHKNAQYTLMSSMCPLTNVSYMAQWHQRLSNYPDGCWGSGYICITRAPKRLEQVGSWYNITAQLFTLIEIIHHWYSSELIQWHDDVIKWKHFPRYCPFVWGIHRSLVNSPHKGQWRGPLMVSLICIWINVRLVIWGDEASDLRHHRVHYDVTVMT